MQVSTGTAEARGLPVNTGEEKPCESTDYRAHEECASDSAEHCSFDNAVESDRLITPAI